MKRIKLTPPFPDCAGLPVWEQSIYRFLREWHNTGDFVSVQTSGSTGKPKTLQVSKEMMCTSARKTLQYFNLKPSDKILLCLPADYIAGKMMLVRAIVGGLQLWASEPHSLPFKDLPFTVDFTSIVPLQAYEMLKNITSLFPSANESFQSERSSGTSKVPIERDAGGCKVRNILIGGGAIHPALEAGLQTCSCRFFESYGMTETVSHIALRRINGKERENGFVALPGVCLTTDERECLVIDCPDLLIGKITTNDRAEIFPDGSFRILGRADNVINSGGIKIQPEAIERKIADFFSCPFAVSATADDKLGEKLILAAEESISRQKLYEINHRLLPYEKLREVFVLKLPLTNTQKINRKQLTDRLSSATSEFLLQ